MALLYLVRSSIVPPLDLKAPPAVADEVTGYTIYLADSAGSTVDRVTLGWTCHMMTVHDITKSQNSACFCSAPFALTSASMLQAL